MEKKILVNNIDLQMALIALQSKEKKSTTALVLAEIIRMSRENEHLFTIKMSSFIVKRLAISPELYRRSIFLLRKKQLIKKVGFTYQLSAIAKPCNKITIKNR